jgi:hypothetical protein
MEMRSVPLARERTPVRASDLVMRLAVVLGIASGLTIAAVAVIGLGSGWALVALGEAFLSLALLSQI